MKLTIKITAIGILVMSLIIGSMLLIAIFTSRAGLEEKIGENQLALAKSTMEKIDRVLYNRLQEIKMIAQDEEFEDSLSGRDDFIESQEKVNKLLFLTGPWDDLEIFTKEGILIVGTDKEEIGKNINIHDEDCQIAFANVLENEKPYYSDVYISGETGKQTMVFAAILRDETKSKEPVVGVVLGQFSWPVIEEILDNLDSRAHLFNSEGLLLASNSPVHKGEYLSEAHQHQSIIEHTLENKEMYMVTNSLDDKYKALVSHTTQEGYLSYKGNDWILFLETPTEVAFTPVQKTTQNLLIAGLLIMIITIFITLFFARGITKPILKLKKSADKISKGYLSEEITVESKDEIGELAKSFDDMRYNLKTVVDEYEKIKGKEELMKKLELSMAEKEEVQKQIVIFKSAVEGAADAITLTDIDGNILYCNPAIEKMFGYGKGELNNKQISVLMSNPENMEKIHPILVKKGRWEDEDIYKKKNNKTLPVLVSISTIKDAEGRPTNVLGIVKDITERKKKTSSLEQFAKLSEGRELKMLELKKQVKELERKLGKKK